MRLLVAITDLDWFNYLSELRPDEVNFWQPSGSGSFRALSPGEPLLFKLHAPNNFIVGGGFFSHHTILPASFAWSAFGQKNGAATEFEMRRRIEKYRGVEPDAASDYSVGCILLPIRTKKPFAQSSLTLRSWPLRETSIGDSCCFFRWPFGGNRRRDRSVARNMVLALLLSRETL